MSLAPHRLHILLVWPLALLGSMALHAQTSLPPAWIQVYLQHKGMHGIFLEADAGYRGDELATHATTALARVGAGRHWKAGYATAGVAWFENIDPAQVAADRGEFRLYQKLLLRQPFSKFELSHIYRAEERWLQRADHSGFDFQLRLRYMLQAAHSFDAKTLLKGNAYLTANTEIFLVPDDRVFSQYRIYGGGGIAWNKKWKWELGYLHLWLPKKPTGTHGNAVIRTSVSYSW